MIVCDAHKAAWHGRKEMSSGEGYLLAAQFLQKSVIQEKLLDQGLAQVPAKGISREALRGRIEASQGSSPWLICEDCVTLLNLTKADQDAARVAARRWWRDKKTPGHVPGKQTQASRLPETPAPQGTPEAMAGRALACSCSTTHATIVNEILQSQTDKSHLLLGTKCARCGYLIWGFYEQGKELQEALRNMKFTANGHETPWEGLLIIWQNDLRYGKGLLRAWVFDQKQVVVGLGQLHGDANNVVWMPADKLVDMDIDDILTYFHLSPGLANSSELCDLCKRQVNKAGRKLLPASQMQTAVQAGFRPQPGLLEHYASASKTVAQVTEEWLHGVLDRTADWRLCPSCVADVERPPSKWWQFWK